MSDQDWPRNSWRDLGIPIATAALGALVAYFLWGRVHILTDSPILVRDGGSIWLQSPPPYPLSSYRPQGPNILIHANPTGELNWITLPNGTKAECRGSAPCGFELTLNNTIHSKLTIERASNDRGLRIQSTIPFADWNRNGTLWSVGDHALAIDSVRIFGTKTHDHLPAPCGVSPCELWANYNYP